MNLSFARGMLRGALVLAIATATAASGATAAQAAAPRITLTAMAFEHTSVDASSGSAVDDLTWTVKNTDPEANGLYGSITLRMRSSATGAFVGHERVVDFAYDRTCCGGAEFVSGTPQESTYKYSFGVPRYSDAATTTWEVTKLTASSNGLTLSVGAAKLATFASKVTATTEADTDGPSLESLMLVTSNPARPYRYVADGTARVTYDFGAQDQQSGFWKGSLKLTGPGGQSVTTPFTWEYSEYSTDTRCGDVYGGDLYYMSCRISAILPQGAAAGRWQVAQIVLVNNAGVRSVFRNPQVDGVTVTSNAVLSADNFAISPTEADNWRGNVSGTVTFDVAGLSGGLSSVEADFGPYSRCDQRGPATLDGTKVTVTFVMWQRSTDCTLTGLAIVDGAGTLALYGSNYGAPDPGLKVRRKPNTTPPVVTGATIDPATISLSQLGERSPLLRIQAEILTAPINGIDVKLYAADGEVVYQSTGGSGQRPDGTIEDWISLSPWGGIEPGTYTVGFRLSDEGGLYSTWGMLDRTDSKPVPGGPVTLTITEG
ncbi:hypothetical protein JIG36_15845 [Actinoplanes sp. LDG1-06]|uniref:Uncharacterized protein n=1 Tax=Paractinoplanes ovalisporus TaxID=2810368 RepID=A0ABS2AB83_9ACTN|nr:hypothetical protein [Actinoplanes ovalisporus]MBM2617030.1 hypothetical protein [Actinoplanes ovalisporus]